MRSLIRSLFVLSLAAAPLAGAATQPPSVTPGVSSTSDSTATAEPTVGNAAVLGPRVQELEATLSGMRRELSRLRAEEDARTRVIGDPDNHPLWP